MARVSAAIATAQPVAGEQPGHLLARDPSQLGRARDVAVAQAQCLLEIRALEVVLRTASGVGQRGKITRWRSPDRGARGGNLVSVKGVVGDCESGDAVLELAHVARPVVGGVVPGGVRAGAGGQGDRIGGLVSRAGGRRRRRQGGVGDRAMPVEPDAEHQLLVLSRRRLGTQGFQTETWTRLGGASGLYQAIESSLGMGANFLEVPGGHGAADAATLADYDQRSRARPAAPTERRPRRPGWSRGARWQPARRRTAARGGRRTAGSPGSTR